MVRVSPSGQLVQVDVTPTPRPDGDLEQALHLRVWSHRDRRVVGKVAIHGGAGDSQHFRNIAGRDALLPDLTCFGGIGVVDLAWASALAPVRCGSDETGPGPFDHGVAFELGECGHDGEHGFAHRPFGVQTFVTLRNPIPREVNWSTTARTA
jgi:hypothetical protein